VRSRTSGKQFGLVVQKVIDACRDQSCPRRRDRAARRVQQVRTAAARSLRSPARIDGRATRLASARTATSARRSIRPGRASRRPGRAPGASARLTFCAKDLQETSPASLYSAASLAKFLGWPLGKVQAVLDALSVIDEGLAESKDYEVRCTLQVRPLSLLEDSKSDARSKRRLFPGKKVQNPIRPLARAEGPKFEATVMQVPRPAIAARAVSSMNARVAFCDLCFLDLSPGAKVQSSINAGAAASRDRREAHPYGLGYFSREARFGPQRGKGTKGGRLKSQNETLAFILEPRSKPPRPAARRARAASQKPNPQRRRYSFSRPSRKSTLAR
jgi:hypothetical protein